MMHTAQFPIWIGLRRSVFLHRLLLALAVIVGFASCFLNWAVSWRIAWLSCALLNLWLVFHHAGRTLPKALILQEKGVLSLLIQEQELALTLRCSGLQFVHPLLVVIECVAAEGSDGADRPWFHRFLRSTRKIPVFFDQTSPDAFRRLRVWAKWEASTSHEAI